MLRVPLNIIRKIGAASLLLLASQMILFLSTWLNARRLGTEGYGRFGLAMSVSVCAAQFIQWGMDQLLTVKFVRGSAEESRQLLGLLLRQKQLAGILVLFVAGVASAFWKPADERELVFLGAVDGIVLGFTMPSLFDARGQTALWQFFAFLRHAVYVGAVLTLAILFKDYFSPMAVLSMHALAIMLEIILEQLWIQKSYGLPHWPVPPRATLPLWREAAPMALAMLAQQALFFIGPPALQFFKRPGDMGALYLSNQFSIAAASFIAAPAAVIHARLAAAHDPAKSPAIFRRKVWIATLICAGAGIFYAFAFDVAAGKIASVFFTKYAAAPGIISIDAWRLAPIFASAPLASALICAGRLRAFALAHIFALLAGAAVAAIYIPASGGGAAAGAVAAGRFVFLVFCLLFFVLDRTPDAAHSSEQAA